MKGRRTALAVVLVLAAGCGGSPGPTSSPTISTPSPAGPYVVSAIDYHFHDAHPSRPIPLSGAVAFKNQSNNRHNVTFATMSYNHDLPVGGELLIDPASSLFPGPGTYVFYCKYHRDRGMAGVLEIG